MKSIDQLRDLLKHEINDLYSAEQQIMDALPLMIEKANSLKLKNVLQQHLEATEIHKGRLDDVLTYLDENDRETQNSNSLLSGLFNGPNKCKDMQGLINEGEKLMGMNMQPDVMDAAIIARAQKIEHYEIAGYGTARAFAEELELNEIAKKLKATLDEEYETDIQLTLLAIGRLNKEAVPKNERNINKKTRRKKNDDKTTGRKRGEISSKESPGQ